METSYLFLETFIFCEAFSIFGFIRNNMILTDTGMSHNLFQLLGLTILHCVSSNILSERVVGICRYSTVDVKSFLRDEQIFKIHNPTWAITLVHVGVWVFLICEIAE